jgi:FkbM family methyltransferase
MAVDDRSAETAHAPATAIKATAIKATAIKDCRQGKMIFLRSDKYIGRCLELYGEYSHGESELFAQLVDPGQVVVEVGANIGVHTVQLARLTGPSGIVVAFEPQRVIFQMMCANMVMNDHFHVVTVLAAAGRAPGVIKVPSLDYTADFNFGGVCLGEGSAGEPVPVMPLDGLQLPSLRLLKVDVEGMEVEVLAGARQLIAKHRPILYVENDRQEKSPQLIAMIDDLGYDMWWHKPSLFNPDNFAGRKDNVFGSIRSNNMLCLPKGSDLHLEGFRQVSGPSDW